MKNENIIKRYCCWCNHCSFEYKAETLKEARKKLKEHRNIYCYQLTKKGEE